MRSSNQRIAKALNPQIYNKENQQFVLALILLVSPRSRECFHTVLHLLRVRQAILAPEIEARQLKARTLSLLRLTNNLKWIAFLMVLSNQFSTKPAKKIVGVYGVAILGFTGLAAFNLFRCHQNPLLANDAEIVAAREAARILRK